MAKSLAQRSFYRIQLHSHLDPQWASWFGELTIKHLDNGDTVLEGPIVDQPALHGLFARIRDLGLTLVAVNQIASKDSSRR